MIANAPPPPAREGNSANRIRRAEGDPRESTLASGASWPQYPGRAGRPSQHKTQTHEGTCGRAADRRRWRRRRRREPSGAVRAAHRAETAVRRLSQLSGTAATAVEAEKEIPPWQTLDLAKEQDMIRLAKAYPSQFFRRSIRNRLN